MGCHWRHRCSPADKASDLDSWPFYQFGLLRCLLGLRCYSGLCSQTRHWKLRKQSQKQLSSSFRDLPPQSTWVKTWKCSQHPQARSNFPLEDSQGHSYSRKPHIWIKKNIHPAVPKHKFQDILLSKKIAFALLLEIFCPFALQYSTQPRFLPTLSTTSFQFPLVLCIIFHFSDLCFFQPTAPSLIALNINFTLRTLEVRDFKHEFQTFDSTTTWDLHIEV